MSRWLSRKHKTYYLLCGAAIFLGIVLGKTRILLLGLPFGIMALLPLLRPFTAQMAASSQVSHRTAFEGETVSVKLTIHAVTELPCLQVTHILHYPDGSRPEVTVMLLSLASGETRELECEIHLEARGEYLVDHFEFQSLDPEHMVWTKHPTEGGRVVAAYPRLVKVQLPSGGMRQLGHYTGNYVSQRPGEGTELAEIRRYVAGDATKHINWKASLKWQSLHVNARLQEKNADVVFVVDTMQDIGGRPNSYLDRTARGVASLANCFLERKDRVGFIEYGGTVSWLRPAYGKRHTYRILHRLARLVPSGSHAFREMDSLPMQALPAEATLFVFTPLMDRRSMRMLVSLALRGFRPIVVYLSPCQLAKGELAQFPPEPLVQRWWEYEQARKLRELRRSGLTVVRWDGEVTSLGPVLAAAAESRRGRVS
ncbi:MAG: DUF58 domain-containing protein [Firmicutes bacterium]|nr:DUF58 domain-containing protein [Bacillota bacterium]